MKLTLPSGAAAVVPRLYGHHRVILTDSGRGVGLVAEVAILALRMQLFVYPGPSQDRALIPTRARPFTVVERV